MIPFPNICLDRLKPMCHLKFSSDSAEGLTCCPGLGHPLHLASSYHQKIIHKTFNQNLFECNILVAIATHERQFAYMPRTHLPNQQTPTANWKELVHVVAPSKRLKYTDRTQCYLTLWRLTTYIWVVLHR